MTDAASPYADVRSLVEELTLGAGRLARAFLAAAEAAKDQAEKAELAKEFDRQFRSVRVGAAYLVRLDEAALRVGKALRDVNLEATKARVTARSCAASAALSPAPFQTRAPHLERLHALAKDLALSDEAFAAEVTRVAALFDLTPPTAAFVEPAPAQRPQAEITRAALAAKRLAEPPRRRSG